MNTCLLIDPSGELQGMAVESLGRLGVACDVTKRHEGLARRKSYDVVLMDMRPHVSFHDTFRRVLHEVGNAYVIAFMEPHDAVERVLALEMGADAIIVQPLGGDEIGARVQALLRRQAQGCASEERASHARLRLEARTLTVPGQMPLTLSGSEAALLQQLAARPGQVMSRAELLGRSGLSRLGHQLESVELQVSRLRRKFMHLDLSASPIRTVRGQGYAWDDAVLQLQISEPVDATYA